MTTRQPNSGMIWAVVSVLSFGRLGGAAPAPPTPPASQPLAPPASQPAANPALARKLPEVKFNGVGLGDALDFITDVSGLAVEVNWDALRAAGVDRDVPVRASLRDVTIGKALAEVLDQAAGPRVKLHAAVGDRKIAVTTWDDYVAHNTEDREYDLLPLLPAAARGDGDDARKLRSVFVGQITQIIKESVSPRTWDTAGGKPGAIKEKDGKLTVTQTKENQKQIAEVLGQLREGWKRRNAATRPATPPPGK